MIWSGLVWSQMFSSVFRCSQDALNCSQIFCRQLDILRCVQDVFRCSSMFNVQCRVSLAGLVGHVGLMGFLPSRSGTIMKKISFIQVR